MPMPSFVTVCSNNTNKLSPQEHSHVAIFDSDGSNNTNKLSPQEQNRVHESFFECSNNTNKLSPQEPFTPLLYHDIVQIIQINLVLKNLQNAFRMLHMFK